MLINIKTTFKPTFIKNHFFGYYTTKDAIMKDILNGKGYKKGEKKGQVKSVETTPTHYTGYKYLIPLSLIRLSGMKVVKTLKGGYKLAK